MRHGSSRRVHARATLRKKIKKKRRKETQKAFFTREKKYIYNKNKRSSDRGCGHIDRAWPIAVYAHATQRLLSNLRSVTCDRQEQNSYHASNHIIAIRVTLMRCNCVIVTETTIMYNKRVRYL